MRIVHVLFNGRAPCGFSRDVPGAWPSNNVWLPPSDWKQHIKEEGWGPDTEPCKGCSVYMQARITGATPPALDELRKAVELLTQVHVHLLLADNRLKQGHITVEELETYPVVVIGLERGIHKIMQSVATTMAERMGGK